MLEIQKGARLAEGGRTTRENKDIVIWTIL
jgi:hypothetical protein